MKLTTARYYTPNGRVVHERGIAPDLQIGKSQGLREKDLKDFTNGKIEKEKNKKNENHSKEIESNREMQLQAGLKLLRMTVAAGDLRKGLQAFNAAEAGKR